MTAVRLLLPRIALPKEFLMTKIICGKQDDLRQWLNSDFISEFTMDELARIEPKENEVMLTYNDRGLAVSGDHTHYWSATRSEVADLSESAYKYYVDDMVYIPTLDMMKTIDVRGRIGFYAHTAYNDKMQRYMKNDGFILHTKRR